MVSSHYLKDCHRALIVNNIKLIMHGQQDCRKSLIGIIVLTDCHNSIMKDGQQSLTKPVGNCAVGQLCFQKGLLILDPFLESERFKVLPHKVEGRGWHGWTHAHNLGGQPGTEQGSGRYPKRHVTKGERLWFRYEVQNKALSGGKRAIRYILISGEGMG